MSYGQDFSLEHSGYSAADALAAERATFIRRTYGHLAGAILAFIAIEFLLFQLFDVNQVINLLATTPYSWLIVLGVFMVVGWVAQSWAQSRTSVGIQYLGLGLYVVLEALILFPLLLIAQHFTQDTTIIPTAGILTLAVFGGLTATVFVTQKDFSFLGPILSIASLVALGFIVCAILFGGVTLGMFFTLAMIILMSGWILYYTSNVLHHYPTDMHVAAALALFAAVATLFWYMIRLLLILSSRD